MFQPLRHEQFTSGVDQDHPVLFQTGSAHSVLSELMVYTNMKRKMGQTFKTLTGLHRSYETRGGFKVIDEKYTRQSDFE